MSAPDWFDFRKPDYDRVYRERMAMLDNIRANPETLDALKEFYKGTPTRFISDWGMTFDPRNADIGLPTTTPFLLFPRQAEFVNWVVFDLWKKRTDGLAEKSRDMGASWLTVAIAVWAWLFHEGVVIGFGSRKEEYVDKLGEPKSLFWKGRQFINLLPVEFQPVGFDLKRHAPYMRILNPENGAAIVGEAGDNIGRGARTSIYFKDESAFYEHPEAIDAALSQTSNCKIDLSSVNGNGNPFYRKRHGGKVPVFTFHWTSDPRKDEAWYKKQCNDLDAVIVAQEIDIDYNASTTDSWIPGNDIEAAQRNGPADVDPVGEWIVAIDAAHMGDDESIIHKRKGRLNLPQIVRKKIDGPVLASIVMDECRLLEDTGETIGAIVIELDGPGVSCYDMLRRSVWADKVQGIHTGTRLSDGRNYNIKAKAWRDARDYLASPPVSMPRDPELKSQLASVKYSYREGLLLMQAKKEHKKVTGKSPDRGDAFVLTFAANFAKKKPAPRVGAFTLLDSETGY